MSGLDSRYLAILPPHSWESRLPGTYPSSTTEGASGSMAVTDSTTATTILSGAKRAGRGSRRSASISVVIPTLNEAANLPHVLPLIPDFVDEVVLVDGHSKDATIEIARALRPDIRIVLQDRCGKG